MKIECSNKILAITGHRPNKLGGYGQSEVQDKVRGWIRQQFEKLEPSCVISGAALGVDQWAMEIALSMRIPLIGAVPFEGQESKWNAASRKYYDWLLTRCAHVQICSPGGYSVGALHYRNHWMINNSTDLLSILLPGVQSGGTFEATQYAFKKGKPIHSMWGPNQEQLAI